MELETNLAKCFCIYWRIENISLCCARFDEYIKSPNFVVDEMKEIEWQLHLYPRGDTYSCDSISIQLYRKSTISVPLSVEVEHEIAFIGKDGSVLISNMGENVYHLGSTDESLSSVRREEILETKRSLFLPEDTLTVRCKMWMKNETMLQNVQRFARTRIAVEKGSFTRKIENFSHIKSGEIIDSYVIESKTDGKPLMSLTLYPSDKNNQGIHFALTCEDGSIDYSTIRLFLVSASGNKVESNEEEFWFNGKFDDENEKAATTLRSFLFSREMLMAQRKLYLPNGVLTLYCEWAVSRGIELHKIEKDEYDCEKNSDTKEVERLNMIEDMFKNIKSFYDEKFLCDVKLQIGTDVFPAHQLYLAASSPVFATLILKMKEAGTDCIDIGELKHDTASRMLNYIYTSDVEELTWNNSVELYSAAIKFALSGLKCKCSSYIMANLSTSNACEALLLADKHEDKEMKALVMDYVLKHGKEIENSEWRYLMNSNAELAAEVLLRQFNEI